MYRALGIDLGTTNSVVAQLRRGEPEIIANRLNTDATPSIVGSKATRQGGTEILVGTPARNWAARDGENVIRSVKRFMGRKFSDPPVKAVLDRLEYKVSAGADGEVNVWFGGRSYTPVEVSAILLHQLRADAEQRLGEPVRRAVITVPAYFGERQVAATQEAGRMAGLHVLRILDEPTAAALAYAHAGGGGGEGRTILVYDLGGGTFDISILLLAPAAVQVLGIEGDNLLGGDDFDRALASGLAEDLREENPGYRAERKDRLRIADEAESAKIALSQSQETFVSLAGLADGEVTLAADVPRGRFEELIEAQIERTIELTHKAVMEANLTVADIDEVLLVGGSTSIPLVRRRLAEVFGAKRVRHGVNPMQCVALGAAVQSALLKEVLCPECGAGARLEAEACADCGTSLIGGERISCPGCFVPVDPAAAACGKCGQRLDDGDGASRPGDPEVSSVSGPAAGADRQVRAALRTHCPSCGTPASPGASECALCGESLGGGVERDGSAQDFGLACEACREVNVPGAELCAFCGEPMPSDPAGITPKNLGIEVADGGLSVVIPKGTMFPTSTPVTREFVVKGEGRRRLEVAVFEGEHTVAQQNELVGHVTLSLPPGLTGATPVDVSFDLSQDRTIELTVAIRGGERKRAKLERHALDPEVRVQAEDQQREIESFTDQWASELTEAELRASAELVETLDAMATGRLRSGSVFDAIELAQAQLKAQRWVRASDAYLSLFLVYCEKYLAAADLARLRQAALRLRRCRDQADWEAGLAAAQDADRLCDGLGPDFEVLTMLNYYADQRRVSGPLAQEIRATLHELDRAQAEADFEETNRVRSKLVQLYARAREDSGSAPGSDRVGPARLEEAGLL
jgi:molecular chaperone DnaK (HSP70)